MVLLRFEFSTKITTDKKDELKSLKINFASGSNVCDDR
jgi:hypothetical protein